MAARRSAEMSCVIRWVVRETLTAPVVLVVVRTRRNAEAALAVFCAGKRVRDGRVVVLPRISRIARFALVLALAPAFDHVVDDDNRPIGHG